MGDPWNKDHLPMAPEPQEDDGLLSSSTSRALGVMFLVEMVATALSLRIFGPSAEFPLYVIGAAAFFVLSQAVMQLFRRRFGPAVVTLLIGAAAVFVAAFLGFILNLLFHAAHTEY